MLQIDFKILQIPVIDADQINDIMDGRPPRPPKEPTKPTIKSDDDVTPDVVPDPDPEEAPT